MEYKPVMSDPEGPDEPMARQPHQEPKSLGNSLLGSEYSSPRKKQSLFLQESKNISPVQEVKEPRCHQHAAVQPQLYKISPPSPVCILLHFPLGQYYLHLEGRPLISNAGRRDS